MIAAAVLATTLLQPVGDTTWWRTEGAEVMQEADQNVCVLFSFQQKDAVGFFWDKVGLTSIVFFNEQWNFSPSETTVAVGSATTGSARMAVSTGFERPNRRTL